VEITYLSKKEIKVAIARFGEEKREYFYEI